MGLPDADVLLYASQGRAANHAVDPQRLDATFGSGASTGLIRMSHPSATVLHPGPRHAALLEALLLPAGVAGNVTPDAQLSTIAMEQGAALASFDCDLSRLAGPGLEPLHA